MTFGFETLMRRKVFDIVRAWTILEVLGKTEASPTLRKRSSLRKSGGEPHE